MKNIRSALTGIIGCGVLALIASCGSSSSGSSTPATVVRSASLDGTQAGTGATGTGRGAVVVNPTTMDITGGVTFAGLTGNPTNAHVHRLDGTPFLPLDLAADNATATIPANTQLSSADYAELLAGYLYFNVHTAANPNGEIRGQITGTTGVTAGLATLNAAQEGATYTSTATGRGTIVFDSTTREILICYATHNVTNTNNAHVHTGAPGVPGSPNVVNPMTLGTNIVTAAVPATLTAQNVTDLTAGNTYFNIHSSNTLCPPAADCTNGEIRGQIAVQ